MPYKVPLARCIGCHKPADQNWLNLTVEASDGPRERLDGSQYWSTMRTMARGIWVCTECLFSSEWAAVRMILASDSVEPALHPGRACVILCQGKGPSWWRRMLPRGVISWPGSARKNCPSCHHPAHVWGVDNAPPAVRDLALATVRRREPWRWVARVAADIYYGDGDQAAESDWIEADPEDRTAIESGREGP